MFKIIFVIVTICLVFSACTQKKNSVGFEPGNEPKFIEFDYNYFDDGLSYEDSVGNYYNNNKLIVGNYYSSNYLNEAYILLKNISLPDTISALESEVKIKLQKTGNYNFADISTATLKFGRLLQNWKENEATWFNATDTTYWSGVSGFSESDYELMEINNIAVVDDSIYLEIPNELLLDWVENDSTNFGMTIFSEQDDSFLELLSAEAESVFLTFSYSIAEVDTVIEYNESFTSDTFIVSTDEDFQKFNGELKLSNIQPIKMFMQFNISDSAFINQENSGIQNSDDYRRMTINHAELILSPVDDSDYPLGGSINVTPYLVLKDSLDLEDSSTPLLNQEDYEYFYDGTSSDSLSTDQLKINLKYIIQFITSGERDNNGIMIKSINENRDFLNINFADVNYSDIEKRPKLKILYTPPYLDE